MKLWLLATCMLSSEMLQAQSQLFTIRTNADDCEVYVDDKKAGTGKQVKVDFGKTSAMKQIRLERKGYKTEWAVALPDEKSISLSCTHRMPAAAAENKSVILKSLLIDEDALRFDRYWYKYEAFRENGLFERAYVPGKCYDDLQTSHMSFDLGHEFMKAVAATGYVDTNQRLLNTGNYLNYLDAKVTNMKLLLFDAGDKCANISVLVQTEIVLDFKDKFGKSKLRESKSAKSGMFSLDFHRWMSINNEEKVALLQRCIQDAVANGFLELLLENGTVDLNKNDEPAAASTMQPLLITPTAVVKDMKTSLQATVTVKTGESFGTGCVISNEGHVLTSYHVVAGLEDSSIQVILPAGDTVKGKIIRTSKFADLALIKAERKFPYAFKLNSATEFEIADEVLAIGTPASMELSQTVSKGIISGIRKDPGGLTLVQTDVSVNPGNSGGPLLKSPGIFIGVVNSKISGGRMEGLGFCTPVKDVIDYLKLTVKE